MEPQAAEQGSAPSVSDRIGSIFERAIGGDKPPVQQAKPKAPAQEAPREPEAEAPEAASDETEAGETAEASAPVEETFELEVEGERYVLPKKLEKGFLQEKDYTQKSQTLAEQRKNAEFVLEQARVASLDKHFATETAQEQEQLRAIDWALQQPVDWNSMTTDEAFRRKLQLDSWKEQKEKLEKGLGDKHQQFRQKVQTELSKLRQQSIEAIGKRIPGWNEASADAVRAHALSMGLTEIEVGSIIDPRHVEILWQAQQFSQLKASAKKTVVDAKTVKTTPSNPMPAHVKEKLNYRKQLQRTAPNSPERRHAVTDRVAAIFSRR